MESYNKTPFSGLRVNTSKISCDEFEKISPYHIEKIEYVPNGYYIDDADAWCKHPYYYAGLYYIQEPSAMLPASILNVKEGDIVCDLCAAPGGKSTELSCHNPGILVSNDISFSRTIPLVKNMELFGNNNYLICCEEPGKLSKIYRETFDKILVDAPCSGEGMFRKEPHLIDSYKKNGPAYYRRIQQDILDDAYKMLRPGGYLLYSTCTFSDLEDESVINDFLSEHDDLSVVHTDKACGLTGPYDKYAGNELLKGCVHALPHKFKGEGHFVALIHKGGNGDDTKTVHESPFRVFDDLPESVKAFSDNFTKEYNNTFSQKHFLIKEDGYIYMMPALADIVYNRSVRYIRTGICIGKTNKKDRFVPNTSFALSLRQSDFINTIDLPADDPKVIKYLKGETVVNDGCEAFTQTAGGYVLVCVDSHPLGFGIFDGYKIKNLYEKGWVYR